MPFACPACRATLDADLEKPLVRCAACGARLRSRIVETGDQTRVYDVKVVGRPETRASVPVEWTSRERRRLAAWLWWSTVVTLGLVAVLYALARWSR
jgi:uncharacterized protein (DUF983 family)